MTKDEIVDYLIQHEETLKADLLPIVVGIKKHYGDKEIKFYILEELFHMLIATLKVEYHQLEDAITYDQLNLLWDLEDL